MRLGPLVLAIALAFPGPVTAQNSTADGIQALVRGDHDTAVRILRPLAEERKDADPLAAFFLALAYDSPAHGRSDFMRACGLFLRAAAPDNPLLPQARALAAARHQERPLAVEHCRMAGRRGWGVPQPATFVLQPGHVVHLDARGIVVRMKETEKRANVGWGGAGWTFLPIRLTELASSAAGTPRYFMEFFVWMPHSSDDEPRWSLVWFAHEVVGLDTFPAPGDGTIAETKGREPPASFPIGDVARIVVDEEGRARRVVVGAHPRSVELPMRGVQ